MIFPVIKNDKQAFNKNNSIKKVLKKEINIGNNMKNFDDIYERENKRFISKIYYKKHELYKLDEIESLKKNIKTNKISITYDPTKMILSCQSKISKLLSLVIQDDYIKKENINTHEDQKYNSNTKEINSQNNININKSNNYLTEKEKKLIK